MTPADLVVLHEITQLKYRYLRGLDTQDWSLVESCFTDDANVWYDSGKLRCTGAKQLAGFLKNAMRDSVYSTHIAVHPEINLTSPTTAEGIWRMNDIVYFTKADPELVMPDVRGGEELIGAAYYHDKYKKVGEAWKIADMGYVRIFQSVKRPNPAAVLDLNPTHSREKP